MMSLEFIRNATVTGDRVAAMTAEGIALRYPSYAGLFWILTLLCGFLVLAPGQVSVGDQIARRWTDMIWTASPRVKRLGQGEVRYLYYGILVAYGIWGLFVLWLLPALQIAKIGAVLGNIALGVSSLQALYVNRTLLPPSLRPHPLMQLGVGLLRRLLPGDQHRGDRDAVTGTSLIVLYAGIDQDDDDAGQDAAPGSVSRHGPDPPVRGATGPVASEGADPRRLPHLRRPGGDRRRASAPISSRDDVVFSTHRGHGHALAKGVPPRQLIAELFGRATGCSQGRGGSMHLFAPEVGMMGTSGIVGPCILQAAGAGYSFKLLKTDRVAVAFFGDGAVNNGAFHEGLNMAGIWKLPVLFVCENNQFATEVPFAYAAGNPSVAARGAAYGMPGVRGRRQRCAGRLRGRRRGGPAGPGRRRADAARVPDLPHPAARRRDGRLHLPHARRGRGVEGAVPDRLPPRRGPRRRPRRGGRAREHRPGDRRGRRRRAAIRRRRAVARPGDGHAVRVQRAGRRPSPWRQAAARELGHPRDHLHAGHARSPGGGDGERPADLRHGRRDRQARRQLQDDGRALRAVRPRAALRHADLRARLRRPGLRGGDDRHAAGHRFHVRRLRPRRRRRDHQPDRQDAVHEQRPAEDADPAARLHRHRPLGGDASLRATITRCTPTSPACASSCRRRRTTPRGCSSGRCGATTRCSSSSIASCSASRARCPTATYEIEFGQAAVVREGTRRHGRRAGPDGASHARRPATSWPREGHLGRADRPADRRAARHRDDPPIGREDRPAADRRRGVRPVRHRGRDRGPACRPGLRRSRRADPPAQRRVHADAVQPVAGSRRRPHPRDASPQAIRDLAAE